MTSKTNNLTCQNYSLGNTYEKYLKLFNGTAPSAGDSFCNLHRECSPSLNAEGYKTGGQAGAHFYCQGECSPSLNGRCSYAANCTCNIGCGSNPQCVNQGPGIHNLNACNYNQTYFQDTCNDCMLADVTTNICVSAGTIPGCTANIDCNGRHPLDYISMGRYCTAKCQVFNCTPYTYNTISHLCFTSCTSTAQCVPGHPCVAGHCV